MRRFSLAFILVIVLCASNYSAFSYADEYPWKLRMNKQGIAVSTRKVEGSPILEYKASTIVSAPLEKVKALFEDDKKISLWYYQCIKSESVETQNPDQKISYVVLNLPWPVAERDSVFQTIRSINPVSGAVTYTQTALPA